MTHKTEEQLQHEFVRKQLWVNVASAVARAEAAKSASSPASWANRALDEFDKRFPMPKEDTKH